jgi:hypothetical protein
MDENETTRDSAGAGAHAGDLQTMDMTTRQYDALEEALAKGRRVVVFRRGTEYVVLPRRFRSHGGREALDATHPTTGDRITFYIDEIDAFEVVR